MQNLRRSGRMVMNQARKVSQSDLWEKATACVKAAHASGDPKRRAILICLGGFWLNLAQDIKWPQRKSPARSGASRWDDWGGGATVLPAGVLANEPTNLD